MTCDLTVCGGGGAESQLFRNGQPMRLGGWLAVKIGFLSRKRQRYGKLCGEVMSFRESATAAPDYEFNLVDSTVEFSMRHNRRSFRIVTPLRAFNCYCNTTEEMRSWGKSLTFASQHVFASCYTLGSLLGKGRFTRVYRAVANADPTKVFAVKVVRKNLHDGHDPEALLRERHVSSMLSHPTIVQAVDLFSTIEKDYLVFELMRGGTLADLLSLHNKLSESHARVIIRELFTALHYIHNLNVVHCDVRPKHIFCSSRKFPMSIALGDFGMASFFPKNRVNLELLASMVGVSPYISADIVRRAKYGPVADMWSAGVVLFQMLCGDLPFTGDSDHELVENIKLGNLRMDTDSWHNVSPEAKSLVRQLLQLDPNKRISALASLHHRWVVPSCPEASAMSSTTPPLQSGMARLADRDSPQRLRVQVRRPTCRPLAQSLSSLSMVASSSASSPSQSRDALGEAEDFLDCQASSLGSLLVQPLLRSMHQDSSLSGMSAAEVGGGPEERNRMYMTPAVLAILDRGLQRVVSDNPGRMAILMESVVVQRQLSVTLPYRRKFYVAARAVTGVCRLRAYSRGFSTARYLAGAEKVDVDGLNEVIDRRRHALEEEKRKR